ncbi:MAG: hypothetical protein IJF08_08500 [Clostridia bacterium]|nr:hypothetical protein [Clostridia bacterium]
MKHTKQLYALLLCLSLLFSLALPAFASETETESEEQVEWVVSDDQLTLTDGDTVYTRYKLYTFDRFRPHDFYEYTKRIETDNPYVDLIGQPAHVIEGKVIINRDVAVIFDYFSDMADFRVYVTAEGAAALDQFVQGNYAAYELAESRFYSASVDADLMVSLQSRTSDTIVEVAELGNLPYYDVYGYDSTMTFVHVIGVVFENDGQYLYVDYEWLDNTHFDADGNLSFRSGSVPVYTLSAAESEQIAAATEQMQHYSVNLIEDEVEPLDATLSMIFFLLLASPLLYLLPIGLMVLGIVLSHSKKVSNRARWKLVILLAAIWLGLAILAGCVLLIPTFFL